MGSVGVDAHAVHALSDSLERWQARLRHMEARLAVVEGTERTLLALSASTAHHAEVAQPVPPPPYAGCAGDVASHLARIYAVPSARAAGREALGPQPFGQVTRPAARGPAPSSAYTRPQPPMPRPYIGGGAGDAPAAIHAPAPAARPCAHGGAARPTHPRPSQPAAARTPAARATSAPHSAGRRPSALLGTPARLTRARPAGSAELAHSRALRPGTARGAGSAASPARRGPSAAGLSYAVPEALTPRGVATVGRASAGAAPRAPRSHHMALSTSEFRELNRIRSGELGVGSPPRRAPSPPPSPGQELSHSGPAQSGNGARADWSLNLSGRGRSPPGRKPLPSLMLSAAEVGLVARWRSIHAAHAAEGARGRSEGDEEREDAQAWEAEAKAEASAEEPEEEEEVMAVAHALSLRREQMAEHTALSAARRGPDGARTEPPRDDEGESAARAAAMEFAELANAHLRTLRGYAACGAEPGAEPGAAPAARFGGACADLNFRTPSAGSSGPCGGGEGFFLAGANFVG